MNKKDKQINMLALLMAKVPPKQLAIELNKLPLDKLLKVHTILIKHLCILKKDEQNGKE